MKNIRQNKKKKNQGFSLITVIVAVSFVGILGMLVLYISLANLQMKVTDLKGKDSFYTAEQALEEIRTGLQQDVGDSMSDAFIYVMENYDVDVGEGLVSQEEERQKLFQYRFVNDMKNRLRGSDENHYDIEYLKGYLDLETYDAGSSVEETLIVTNPSGKEPLMIRDYAGILLKNIKVIHVDEKGRASIIVTDIRLDIPKAEFPDASTLPDLMNFSLIADEGIVCKSAKDNPAVISGSTYAGRMDSDDQQTYRMGTTNAKERASIWLDSGAGLQIDAGEKFVSEGDILVNNNGTFEFTSGRELWAQGISASSATEVNLTGTIYLSDDLTVESGENSHITISGNYYGYGSADSAKGSLNYPAEDSGKVSEQARLYAGASDADLSSSIIINGKNTTMDLSGTHRLMLAGRSYIASSGIQVQPDRSNADVKTGESLAVKGTQMVYLVPPELLGTAEDKETLNNPMTYKAYLDYLGVGGHTDMPVKSSAKVTAWSGKTLADITGYSAGKDQVQTVFYNDNSAGAEGGGFVYFYLNFASDQKASSFMDQYYSNNETVRTNLDRYLSFYFGPDSGIEVNDPKLYTRYVTNGNILTYDGNTQKGKVTAATSAITSEEMKKEQIGLQNTWYALNRKMLTGVNLLNTKVKEEKANTTHDESDPSRSVFDNIVDEKELASLVDPSTKKREFSNNGKKALIYHNSGKEIKTYAETGGTGIAVAGDDMTLNIDENCGYSLIVCTGDVELAANTEFHGIIVAKGKITLKQGSKLISSSQDASAVFQAVDDGKKLKDVFWDGAEYAPGGTDTDDTENGSAKDIYDLSDCVTYENWKKQ